MRLVFLNLLYPLLALSSFMDPYWGLIGYTFVSVIRPEQLNRGMPPFQGIFALILGCFFLSCVLRKENLLGSLKLKYFLYFFWFTTAYFVSTVISSYTDFAEIRGGIYYVKTFPQIFIFCLCFYAVLTRLPEKRIQMYLKLTLFFFLFMALWGIEQYFRGNTLVEQLFGSTIIDRCTITAVFVLYLPVSIYYIAQKETAQKIFGVSCFAAFICIIVMTQSRAGFLGVLLSFAVVFYYSKRKAKLALCAGAVLIVGLPFVPASYFERMDKIKMQGIQNNEISDYSSASRLLLWKVGLDIFFDHPMVGVGNQNYAKAKFEYVEKYSRLADAGLMAVVFGRDLKGGLTHSHNNMVNILSEGGLVATVPYLLLIWIPLRSSISARKKFRHQDNSDVNLMNLLNAGILGFLVTAFFANMLNMDFFYWNLTLSFFLSQRLNNAASEADDPAPEFLEGR